MLVEPKSKAVVLHSRFESRLNALLSTYSKGDHNGPRAYSDHTQFILDRCLVTNRLPLSVFQHLFEEAVFARYNQLKKEETKEVPNLLTERTISRQELNYFIQQLGRITYKNDPAYLDKIYNIDILSEKVVATKDSMEYPRVMLFDDINRRLLGEATIKVLCDYERELKHLFLIYLGENYWSIVKSNRLLLTEKEIDLQNKKMTAVAFVRFLREAEIVPHLINIEHVEECLCRVVPPTMPKQNEFYYKHYLSEVYSKETDKTSDARHEGDPGLLFFEFQFSLARIAWELHREAEKKIPDVIVGNFIHNHLHIRKNEELRSKNLPNLNKKFLQRLIDYYNKYENDSERGNDDESSQQQDEDKVAVLGTKNQEIVDLPPCELNLPNIYKTLDKELPPMPPAPEVIKEAKPEEKVIIGQQPPPPPVDKNAKVQVKPPAKKQLKKGEPEPRVFKFSDPPVSKPSSEDYFQKLASELEFATKPLSSMERGIIPMQPFPCIISEILYPPEVPESIIPFIEAAINSHNEGNFFMALEHYSNALESWKKELQGKEMSPSIELFFQFTKGTIYSSAGKDDYALQTFFNCRQFVDTNRMQYLNPDRALPWCGIGEVLYNCEEYELGVRSYLKAREIRESLLGLQTVDTATVLNNLGCCFFMLERNKEAFSYFKIAHAVFQAELGTFHQRTQTAMSNIKKSNRGTFQNVPAYRKLWEVYEKDPFGKKKKKKKGDKKKK